MYKLLCLFLITVAAANDRPKPLGLHVRTVRHTTGIPVDTVTNITTSSTTVTTPSTTVTTPPTTEITPPSTVTTPSTTVTTEDYDDWDWDATEECNWNLFPIGTYTTSLPVVHYTTAAPQTVTTTTATTTTTTRENEVRRSTATPITTTPSNILPTEGDDLDDFDYNNLDETQDDEEPLEDFEANSEIPTKISTRENEVRRSTATPITTTPSSTFPTEDDDLDDYDYNNLDETQDDEETLDNFETNSEIPAKISTRENEVRRSTATPITTTPSNILPTEDDGLDDFDYNNVDATQDNEEPLEYFDMNSEIPTDISTRENEVRRSTAIPITNTTSNIFPTEDDDLDDFDYNNVDETENTEEPLEDYETNSEIPDEYLFEDEDMTTTEGRRWWQFFSLRVNKENHNSIMKKNVENLEGATSSNRNKIKREYSDEANTHKENEEMRKASIVKANTKADNFKLISP